MSASLVGSEMCIRDRPALLGFASARKGRAVIDAIANRAYVRGPGDYAVSYTHLTLPTICSV
eukprot:10886373-Alexandrium_andersonii.AAC.1